MVSPERAVEVAMDVHWWSIEVRDGAFPAARWKDAHGESLVEAALTNGAREWNWVEAPWGLVLEVGFREPAEWSRFRDLPGVQAALDAVPDRVNGLYIYPGRGGGAGAGQPRRPRRPRGAGAAPVPTEPAPVIVAGHPPATWRPPLVDTGER
ncbi:hypothetical protein ACFFWC_09680 [Plantactinospora siamensis]|uniref:Uncharacterized protein n=1 Tax=Plantactinospora siamensis TaxID=555372 RepID=A0ABV6P664_9ACTN